MIYINLICTDVCIYIYIFTYGVISKFVPAPSHGHLGRIGSNIPVGADTYRETELPVIEF